MSDTLAQICADKAEHIAKRKQQISESELLETAKHAEAPRGFHKALREKIAQKETALIAEVKKASPSKGIIRADFHPETIADNYQSGGATCLSVLTDTPYFQGEDSYLQRVKTSVSLPLLRKDFMLDTYQVTEARALGADCILLIMAALSDTQAAELEAASHALGMDCLIEVHSAEEMERAVKLQSTLLGINNRNLKTLEVDLATTEKLAPLLHELSSKDYSLICESGVYRRDDVERMQQADIYGFLVGESLMRQEDIEQATRNLLKGYPS